MTSVTDTATPMMNDPFIAYNLVKGEEKIIHETWIKLGWNRFKWLEGRKDKSFVTSTGFTFRVTDGANSYNTESRVFCISGKDAKKSTFIIPDLRREFGELCAAWQLEQTSVQGNTVPMVNESVLSMTRTETPECRVQIYTSHTLGSDVNFKATNGMTISIGRWNDRYDQSDKRLYITTTARVTTIGSTFRGFSDLMKDWEKVQVALREFDASHTNSVRIGSTNFSEWTYPGIVNTDPSLITPIPSVHMTKKLYEYVKKHIMPSRDGTDDGRFISSNGVIIQCKNSYTPGYQNADPNTLHFDHMVAGKDWVPTRGRAEYNRDFAKIQAALKELEAQYTRHKSTKSKRNLHISEKVYKYAKKHCNNFKASNGITINCADRYVPGFENPLLDNLYVDNEVIGKDWFPRTGRAEYLTKVDRVRAAVVELNAKYAQHKKDKVAATQPTPTVVASPVPTALSASTPVSATVPSTPTALSTSTASSNVVAFTENVARLVGMGFSRDDAIRGLVVSGNDFVEAIKNLIPA